MNIEFDNDELLRLMYWHIVFQENGRMTQADRDLFEKISKSLDEHFKAQQKLDAKNDYDW